MSVQHREAIIKALNSWYQSHSHGPTFAELCQLLGWSQDRRGSLQRWLKEMKGTDVEWEPRRRRSLRLIVPAQAEDSSGNGSAPQPTTVASPSRLDERFLSLCATGLYEWLNTPLFGQDTNKDEEEDRPADRSRLPLALRLALSQMDLALLLSGREPLDLQGFLALMDQPCADWPVRLEIENLSDEDALLANGELSPFGEYWVLHHKGLLHELQESLMRQIVDLCRTKRLFELYRFIRRLFVEKPAMPFAEFQRCIMNPLFMSEEARPLTRLLRNAYVDLALLCSGDRLLCQRCGYIMKQAPNGDYVCPNWQCEEMQAIGMHDGETRTVSHDEEWVALAPGLHRFVTIPGLYELDLLHRLEDLGAGLELELWPEGDRYDLYIQFPDGERWAVDLKNWEYLGNETLRNWPVPRCPTATLTIVVFPDDRKRIQLDKIRPALEPQLGGIRLMWVSELLRRVEAKVAKISGAEYKRVEQGTA